MLHTNKFRGFESSGIKTIHFIIKKATDLSGGFFGLTRPF